MTGVRLHRSNRMEALAAELARLMCMDPVDPFAPERIVVPHPTIGRWLSLELASGLGVAANLRFEQPAEFAWSIMRGVVPQLSPEQPYTPARLRWRIHDLLSGPAEGPGEGGERAPRGGPEGRSRRNAAGCLARWSRRPSWWRPAGRIRARRCGSRVGGCGTRLSPGRGSPQAARSRRSPRARIRPMPALPPGLDPGVGAGHGSPLAGEVVAAPGGNGRP